LEYFRQVKARGFIVAAVAAVVALACAGGAAARVAPHRRHVEVRRAQTSGQIVLGKHGGFDVALDLQEPHLAILQVGSVDDKGLSVDSTTYGAHFRGSLVGGTVRARFGGIGSIALRFHPAGKRHYFRREMNCQGPRPRSEAGIFVGKVSLRGEAGYFRVVTAKARGTLDRTLRVVCRVKSAQPRAFSESLREAVERGRDLVLGFVGHSFASLLAGGEEGGREILFRAAHGSIGGTELGASTFEREGRMPVARVAWVPTAPGDELLTTLPGEFPGTATVKGSGAFKGKGEYVGDSRTAHEWTGDLAVAFPGLLQPLTGPRIYSTLCVVSPLLHPKGCDAVPPDWQGPEIPVSDAATMGEGSRG